MFHNFYLFSHTHILQFSNIQFFSFATNIVNFLVMFFSYLWIKKFLTQKHTHTKTNKQPRIFWLVLISLSLTHYIFRCLWCEGGWEKNYFYFSFFFFLLDKLNQNNDNNNKKNFNAQPNRLFLIWKKTFPMKIFYDLDLQERQMLIIGHQQQQQQQPKKMYH